MDTETVFEKMNNDAFYTIMSGYEIEYTHRDSKIRKVEQSWRLLRGIDGPVDYDKAFQLLSEVCSGKKKPSKRRPSKESVFRIPKLDDDEGFYAAESWDDIGLPVREYACSVEVGTPSIKPKIVVEKCMEDPDDVYALAHLLMAELCQMGKGRGKDPNEAIRQLRMADKYGVKRGERLENLARIMMRRILSEEDEATIADTVKSSVEIRDLYAEKGAKKGERYAIILHHTDGTESEIEVQGRNKLVYMLALMTTKRQDATRLRARLFYVHHEALVGLVDQARIKTNGIGNRSYGDWVNEFIYHEKPDNIDWRDRDGHEGKGMFSYDPQNYSMTKDKTNRKIAAAAISENEKETYQLKTKGNREKSFMYLQCSPDQIIIPESLIDFVDELPTDGYVMQCSPSETKWMPYRGE